LPAARQEVMGGQTGKLAGWAGLAASTVEPTDQQARPSTTTARSGGSGRGRVLSVLIFVGRRRRE